MISSVFLTAYLNNDIYALIGGISFKIAALILMTDLWICFGLCQYIKHQTSTHFQWYRSDAIWLNNMFRLRKYTWY